MKIVKPNTRHLKKPLADAAKGIATRLASKGFRTWIVGGAVRDLALGLSVHEVDLATAALPDEIEALFEQTVPVGKAFGTVIVLWKGQSVEVTTFRSELGYSDGRRPDAVEFGKTPEEDARRRDFTCNALFLDPLTEEVLDPEGGLADLAAGVLAAIGNAAERFREDGLRLMRLARFQARLELTLEPETETAARAERQAIERISAERIFQELHKILTSSRAHVAMGLLVRLGILELALPALGALHGPHLTSGEALARRVEVFEWLESDHAGVNFALLFDPLGAEPSLGIEALERLRPSRELLKEVKAIWSVLDQLEALWPMEDSTPERGPDRSSRLRILADPAWPRAKGLAAALGDARTPQRSTPEAEPLEGGHLGRCARELEAFARGLSADEIEPAPWIRPADLGATGVAPSPLWGQVLAEAYELQLQAELVDREQALGWLKARLSSEG